MDPRIEQLPHLAHDLSGGDSSLVERIRAALRTPPNTLETVGYYGTRGFSDEKNCYLFMITQLANAGHLLEAEDKHVTELLDRFVEDVGMPDAMRSWFPKRYGWDKDFAALGMDRSTHGRAVERVRVTYDQVMGEIERRYDAKGTPLRLLQMHEGDTMSFIATTPESAAKWTDVVVAQDARGRPLGLQRPDWQLFLGHFAYATGWFDELLPS